jgi:hypothetical protein
VGSERNPFVQVCAFFFVLPIIATAYVFEQMVFSFFVATLLIILGFGFAFAKTKTSKQKLQ